MWPKYTSSCIKLTINTVYTHVQVEFLGDDFKVKFLGSTYARVMFMDMFLTSGIECEYEKKTSLLYLQYTHRL